MALSIAARKAIAKEMAQRYRRVRKGERTRMLDNLCALAQPQPQLRGAPLAARRSHADEAGTRALA